MSELIGKHILIGITCLDQQNKVIDQYQTHGKIVSVDDEEGIAVEKADGSGLFNIPPEMANLHPAQPGEYKLRSTGEVVVNPDLVASWAVYSLNKKNLLATLPGRRQQ